MLKAIFLLALVHFCVAQTWHALDSSLTIGVFSMTSIPDGSGGHDLVLCGPFISTFSGLSLPGIAKWDGTSFSNIFGTASLDQDCLWVDGESLPGQVIVGGDFHDAGGLGIEYAALFDLSTSSWSSPGAGLDQILWTSYATAADVYMAGSFSHSGTASINRVATFSGTAFAPMDQGIANYDVFSIIEYNNDIYAAGMFNLLGSGLVASNIATWDGSVWNPMGSGPTNGMDGTVHGMAIYNGQLLAVGDFTRAGSTTVQYLALWDGLTWSAFGSPDQPVACVEIHNGDPYVGGFFSSIDLDPMFRVAHYNGSQWMTMNSGMTAFSDSVSTLKSVNNILYAGGYFTVSLPTGNAHNVLAWY